MAVQAGADNRGVTLTTQTLLFLDAWAAYLRERFNAAGIDQGDALALNAFEVGFTIAALSWNIAAQTMALRARRSASLYHNSCCPESAPGRDGLV
jgi:hypothetical protein